MRKFISVNILIIFLLGLPLFLFAQNDLPDKPDAWVNDYANILNGEQESILNGKLNRLEKATSTQIFLAIFERIPENYYLDDFVVKLYEKWRPGRKNENNGVLIAMFTADRKIRIEVGYGLEGVLTDMQAGRVIDDVITPEFKRGDYFAGLNNGIDVIISAVKGEYTIPIKGKSKSNRTNWVTLFIIFFVIISILRRFGGRGTTISRKGSKYSRTTWGVPFFLGGGSGGSSFGGGGGGFSGGFGGLSGGGGASGSW